jgi:hypothetical protein
LNSLIFKVQILTLDKQSKYAQKHQKADIPNFATLPAKPLIDIVVASKVIARQAIAFNAGQTSFCTLFETFTHSIEIVAFVAIYTA